jgi:hypothetical protein
MNFLNILLMLHVVNRWLVTLAALIAIGKLGWSLIQKSAYGAWDKRVLMIFSGLMDLQGLLGLVVLIGKGLTDDGWPLYRFIHMGIMLAAIFVGHVPSVFGKNWPEADRVRNGLFCVAGALVIIFVGIMALP